jgi:hypothetical protein
MAIAILSWLNHVDRRGVITVTPEPVAGFPASNLANDKIKKRCRIEGGTVQIDVDFGIDVECGVIAMAQPDRAARVYPDDPYTLLAEDDTWEILLDPDGGTPGAGAAYDSGTMETGVQPRYGYLCHIIQSPVQARYAQITITSSVLSYMDFGRLWIGPYFQPGRNFAYDWVRRVVSGTQAQANQVTPSMIQYVDEGERAHETVLPFEYLSDADAEIAFSFIYDVGKAQQFLLCWNPDDATRTTRFARLADEPGLVERFFGVNGVTLTAIESR